MNYRQKCKIKGEWAFVKYKGDYAIYAVCQNCGFIQHDVYENKRPPSQGFIIVPCIDKLYRYCPSCGLKMHLFDGERVYKVGYDDQHLWIYS